ncbi:hypothetical protein [Candidatus Avelusimicrobium luingense]|uniref:hypothetical protein n=1 Tax=Candidatus Avelusimicrobium luingense TaxID=3416211 RepID=UPI003D0C1B01
MKKLFLLLCLLCVAPLIQAQDESLLFIHPGRETMVNFPSESLGNTYTVSFFLPEDSVPLKQNYPVIVALGLVPKEDASFVAAYQKGNPAIVVGINFTEQDYTQKADKIVRFLSDEILPYTDANYLTKNGPENRILAVQGPNAAKIALRVAQNPNLFGAVALIHPGNVWENVPVPSVRILGVGTQEELARAQQVLEQNGKIYGPDFALRYDDTTSFWLNPVNTQYLWASQAQVQLKTLKADVLFNHISLSAPKDIPLRVWAVLADNSLFHYVPVSVRISPPFLAWDPMQGVFRVLAGAEPGKVKIYQSVDKNPFSVKIRLKK